MPKGRYTRTLNVSTPDGQRLYAIVIPGIHTVHIEVRYIEAVKNDDPPFAKNGVIGFNVERGKYKIAINQLQSYLESVILEGMEKDESIYSSLGIKPQRRRNKKSSEKRTARVTIGIGDSSGVHNSTRGKVETKGAGRGATDSDLAEGSSESVDGED